MKDLSTLSAKEVKIFLDSFDIIISDCDGVLWNLSPFPGVKEAIADLHNIGKTVNFLSNNSQRELSHYDEALAQIGVKRTDENFIYPVDTIVDYMVNHNFVGKKVFAIAPEHLNNSMRAAGINVITAPNAYEYSFQAVAYEGRDDKEVEGVFVDGDLQLNYLKIFKAVSILHRPGVPLMVGATDRIIPFGDLTYPGPGFFIDLFTEATGKHAKIVGKPGKHLRKVVKQRFNITDPRRVLFIGDMLQQDIAFGSICDFQTLLVLSGATSKEQLEKVSEDLCIPDFYLNSFADFTLLIRKAYS